MEEITFCLKSNDEWVQEEGILKLCEKLKKAGLGASEAAEFRELTALLTGSRPSTGRLAARGVALLVAEGTVPLADALRSALSSVAVGGSCGDALVWLVTELLQTALQAAAGGQKALPSLSSAQHPHVTLLRALPQHSHQLGAELERLLLADDSPQYCGVALEYVTPFLWACCGPQTPSHLRARLVSALCRQARLSRTPLPIHRALQLLSRVQVPPAQLCWELPPLCRRLVEFAEEINDRALLRSLTPLTVHCLQLQVSEGLSDVSPALSEVTRLLELGVGGDVELVLLSDTIARSSALSIRDGKLIGAVCRMLEGGRYSPHVAALLVPPLLRAVSLLPGLTSLVEPLLALLAAGPSGAAGRLQEAAYWPAVADISPDLCRAALLADTLAANEEMQLSWLNHLESTLSRSEPDAFSERAALALIVCTSSSPSVRGAALRAALAAVRQRPGLAVELFYCIIYRLKVETDPEMVLTLLRALPELAVSKAVVPPLVRLLTGLVTSDGGRGPLAADAVRLLAAVWRREERCLPYLLSVLKMEGPLSAQSSRLLLARLAAIADICTHSPTSGKDQLSALSRVLTELTTPESGAACSLALTGISALCQAEVLDVRTTWRILAPKLRQERRTPVLARYMDFLALVPQLHVPSEEYEAFTLEVSTVLWQQVTGKRPPAVVRAALRALSFYKPGSFTLRMLPAAAKVGLVVPAKLIATPSDAARSPEELMPYVPGDCYTRLLTHLPPELLEEYGHTLTGLVGCEIKLIGRGVYFTAKEKARREGGEPSSLAYLEPASIVRALVAYLQTAAGGSEGGAGEAVLAAGPAPPAALAACLQPLAADLGHALPPLNLSFLLLLAERGGPVAALCVEALARHCCTHPSAADALKVLMAVPPSDGRPPEVTDALLKHLGMIGRGVPPAVLMPFVQHHLSTTLGTASSDACRVLAALRTALKDERLHEANRATIGHVMEAMADDINPEQTEVFTAFLEGISELPTSHLERLSSPSLWWSVEKAKLVVAAAVRSHMSCLGEGDSPMVWMNDIIDAAGSAGLGADVEVEVCRALAGCCGHASAPDWLLELLFRLRAVQTGRVDCDTAKPGQVLGWLADVLACAVLLWSPLTLTSSPTSLASSASARTRLFPAAARLLLRQPRWRPVLKQVYGWLQRLQDEPSVADRLRLPLLLPLLQPAA
ncbi:focadhesin-like [Amphibalanus amphitrite]|uniref:focadhesin-like n=1 Tax=Amphibalanus amphitrite TaxID=1232801 RepID=UPI001C929786|nr:focadhesin-like [Amphibalanus amphitrite]